MTMSVPHVPPIAADDPSCKRALVLAGGGMRVAYQAGVIRALSEAGLRFAFGDGSSGGTINLAALLSGATAVELCRRWSALDVKRFASFRSVSEYLHAGNLPALGNAAGLVDYVYPALGIDMERLNSAQGIDANFNVCRFDDKTVQRIAHGDLDLARLVACVSLPIFMPAVESDGATWTDAVWIKDCDLLACVERGARDLWLVWCVGNTPKFLNGAFNQYVHMIEMSAVGALNSQLATISDYNRRLAAGEELFGSREPITVHIVRPELPIPLDPDFYFGRIDAATLVDMGYRDARRVLKAGASPLDPSATQMKSPGVGVSFRETMAGGFALGTADPEEGAKSRDQMAIHCSIQIDDVQAFVADPNHKADLVGHLDFTPFGSAIPAESGVFGLFTPSGDPRMTYMVYELGFRHEARSYYLAGKKHVVISAPWKLWPQTTTLYCTLHEGTDESGPVVGAGILRLSVKPLLSLLASMYATHAPDGRASVAAIARFFGFFARELVRTYILRRPLSSSKEN